MTKIRSDLDGVVYVTVGNGDPIRLQAGDDVPKGATVGKHLIADVEPAPAKSGRRPRNDASAMNAQD